VDRHCFDANPDPDVIKTFEGHSGTDYELLFLRLLAISGTARTRGIPPGTPLRTTVKMPP
jgi:hypothetical protein